MTVPGAWYLGLAALLFGVGATGLLVRRNILVMFMCVELMLNAVNLTFITFARMLDDIGGQTAVFFVLVVAAAEVVVGLGIIVAIFRRRDERHRRRPAHSQGLSRPLMNAAYVILALPLAGFLLLLWLGRKLGEPIAGWLAVVVGGGVVHHHGGHLALRPRASRRTIARPRSTSSRGSRSAACASTSPCCSIPCRSPWCSSSPGISTLIFLYSIGYMHGDPAFAKFFMLMNLFLFSMLCLVMADNFLFCFLGWEGVGFCSYQLISFWFERDKPPPAGKKAFVTNRVGDFGFMIGMFLIFEHFGSLNFTVVFRPLLSGAPGALAAVTASAIGFMLLLGAAGKSAQMPLYIWLPDAMEGPTPVSALIHAATMVTAGVYLMVRIAPILHYAPDVLTTMAIMGAVTALIAAGAACAQDDIKKVLAYSTISQLGYMFLGIGSGGYAVGPVPHDHPRLLQGPALPRRRLGHPRDARRAGHEAHGRTAQVDADHLRHLPHRVAGHLGDPPLRRLLVKGRRAGRGVAQEPDAVGRRLRRRRAHRLLHDPPGRPGLVRKPRWQDEAHPAEAAAVRHGAAESAATAGARPDPAAGHGGA